MMHNKQLVVILFFIVFIMCEALCMFTFASVVSLVTFGLFLLYVLQDYTIFFIKYFYILFVVVATIVSCVFLEFQTVFLHELRVFSGFHGSIPLLTLAYYILIITIITIDKRYKIKLLKTDIVFKEKKEIQVIKVISMLVFCMILICFVMVLPHPAFLVGLERFDYSNQYGLTGVFSKMAINIPRLIIFPFILTVSTKGNSRRLGIACLVGAAFYYLWVGNKFGAFFELLCIFLMVLSGQIVNRFGQNKLVKIISRIGVIFAFLIIMTLVIQSFTYQGGSIYTYFSSRVNAEGQLWWSIYDTSGGKIHVSELSDELQMFELGNKNVVENVGAHYGIYKMMYLSAPNDYVNRYLSAGYRYTEAGFAVAYYYLGMLGPLIYAVIMGWFFAFVTNAILIAINKRQIFRIFLHLRFWLYGTTAFSMFIFSAFFTPMSLVYLGFLIFTYNKNLFINISNSKLRL